MPCGCFGGGKKAKAKIGAELKDTPPPPVGESTPTMKIKGRNEEDPSKTAKKKDVVATQDGEDCALLGFRPTGSRPPSSVVDSPNSNSHTHTPSTAPIAASATSSQNTSLSQSPSSGGRHAATCRAQLIEKRREFFRDFIPEDYKSSPYTLSTSSSTLPSASRAQKFGKVRGARPLSQPHSPDSDAPPPPPGPHLLRHTPVLKGTPKIDSDDSSFGNPEFLLELKNASEEISRRWAMSDDDETNSPSSLKMRARPRSPPNVIDTDPFFQTDNAFEHREQNSNYCMEFTTSNLEQEKTTGFGQGDGVTRHVNYDTDLIETNLNARLTPSPEVIDLPLDERSYPTQHHSSLPQTMITPPSPPVNADDPLFSSSASPPLRADPCDASSDEENDDACDVHLDNETQAQMVELLSRQNQYDDDDDDPFRDHENKKPLQNDDITMLPTEPVITFSDDPFREHLQNNGDQNEYVYYSQDIRRSSDDEQAFLISSDDVDFLGDETLTQNVNVNYDEDENIFLSTEVTNPRFTLEEIEEEEHSEHPSTAEKEVSVDQRHEIDSPMDDSPSELESLSTTANTDRRKIDPNESIHLHDDGLGSEIDEGFDITDEHQQLQQQKQHQQQASVGGITSEEKST